MLNMFSSHAKIVYDPHRGEMARRTSWWCVGEVDREITRYCRWWLQREKHIHLAPPAWDAHISIVRGEKPQMGFARHWKDFHKQRFQFEWDHTDIRKGYDKHNGGDFYWINVTCPQFDEIRKSLGLPTGFKYHITIGRTHEYEARVPKNLKGSKDVVSALS
jgi:hypothetical protein